MLRSSRLVVPATVLLLLLATLTTATDETAADNCRHHLQRVAQKFCPQTKCVEKVAMELATELSDSMERTFAKVEDFCCRRMCTHEDLRRLCCGCQKKKHLHHHHFHPTH